MRIFSAVSLIPNAVRIFSLSTELAVSDKTVIRGVTNAESGLTQLRERHVMGDGILDMREK